MDSFSSKVTFKEDNGSTKQTRMSKMPSMAKKKHCGSKQKRDLRFSVSNKKLRSPKANLSEVSRSLNNPHGAVLSKDSKRSPIKHLKHTDEPENGRSIDTYEHSRCKARAVIKNKKPSLGSSAVERSSANDFSRESLCVSGSRKRLRSSNDIHVQRTTVSEDDMNHCIDTNDDAKRTKRSAECANEGRYIDKSSTCKTLKLTSGPVKQIDKNKGSFTENLDHITVSYPFLQTSTSRSQLSVCELEVNDNVVCRMNEEDHESMEFDQYEDEDEDDEDEEEEEEEEEEDAAQYQIEDDEEDITTWQSKTHASHDTTLEHTGTFLGTGKQGIDEFELEERPVSGLAKEGALNDISDERVDDLEVPLFNEKEDVHGRSDILSTQRLTSSADRSPGGFIRSENSGIHVRADSYDYQSTSLMVKGTAARPNLAACLPDLIPESRVCNFTSMELDSEVGNRYSEVDPILIPGPPGSFLPSPGEVESEDYQGNSSLTVSLISCHEQRISGGNLLDSPSSGASSISNSITEVIEKADEKLPSAINAPVSPDSMRIAEPQSECGIRKRFLKPQNDCQPCCCSRKERISLGCKDEYKESQLLRRRTMSTAVLPIKEKMNCSLNTGPSYSCAVLDIYPLSNSSNYQLETVPAASSGFASPKCPDAMTMGKFPNNGESDSASPSAVLRLMGKNLMVAKNGEDSSDKSKFAAPSGGSSKILNCATACPSNNLIRGYCLPQHQQQPVLYDPSMASSEYCYMQQSSNCGVPNGYGAQINSLKQQRGSRNLAQDDTRLTPDMHMITSRTAPLDLVQWQTQQHQRILNGIDMLHGQTQKVMTCDINFRKDVPILANDDDSAIVASKNCPTTYSNGLRESCVSLATPEHEQSRHLFSSYHHHHCPPVFAGCALPGNRPMYMQQLQAPKTTTTTTCYPVPYFSGHGVITNNPVRLNYSENGSHMLQQQQQQRGPSFMASSLHARPDVFYSPRLP